MKRSQQRRWKRPSDCCLFFKRWGWLAKSPKISGFTSRSVSLFVCMCDQFCQALKKIVQKPGFIPRSHVREGASPCSATPSELRAINTFSHLFPYKWMTEYSLQIETIFFQWCNITWSVVWRKCIWMFLDRYLENSCLLFTFTVLLPLSSTTLLSLTLWELMNDSLLLALMCCTCHHVVL